jgi:hypothetical protein
MADTRESIVFRVECNNTTSVSVDIIHFECSLQAKCFTAHLITIVLETVKQLADMIMSLVLLICQFGIRPDLFNIS